jgi:uncharacterized protein (UPF0548 family)
MITVFILLWTLMIVQFSKPSPSQLEGLIAAQEKTAFSYSDFDGFTHDDNRIAIGQGRAVFEKAKEVFRTWQHFPVEWAFIHPNTRALETGGVVAMSAKAFGFWWLNLARIVYTIDETNRFGFAYGTLLHHVECGEELFELSIDAEGQVWYRIEAYSKPRYWLVRLAKPLARQLQKRFVKESLAKMRARFTAVGVY